MASAISTNLNIHYSSSYDDLLGTQTQKEIITSKVQDNVKLHTDEVKFSTEDTQIESGKIYEVNHKGRLYSFPVDPQNVLFVIGHPRGDEQLKNPSHVGIVEIKDEKEAQDFLKNMRSTVHDGVVRGFLFGDFEAEQSKADSFARYIWKEAIYKVNQFFSKYVNSHFSVSKEEAFIKNQTESKLKLGEFDKIETPKYEMKTRISSVWFDEKANPHLLLDLEIPGFGLEKPIEINKLSKITSPIFNAENKVIEEKSKEPWNFTVNYLRDFINRKIEKSDKNDSIDVIAKNVSDQYVKFALTPRDEE